MKTETVKQFDSLHIYGDTHIATEADEVVALVNKQDNVLEPILNSCPWCSYCSLFRSV